MKLYMFRTVRLSIIRSYSLYTQQWYISYRFVDSFRAGPEWNRSKFVKLMHIVGFITKKFATMHDHTNVKICMYISCLLDATPCLFLNVLLLFFL